MAARVPRRRGMGLRATFPGGGRYGKIVDTNPADQTTADLFLCDGGLADFRRRSVRQRPKNPSWRCRDRACLVPSLQRGGEHFVPVAIGFFTVLLFERAGSLSKRVKASLLAACWLGQPF